MRDASGLTGVLGFVWFALLLAAPVTLLIPFQGDSGMKTAGWLGGYLAGVAGQLYGLIKVAMLWIVPGMLLSLMMPRQVIQCWAVVAAAGCYFAGWAILPAMGWSEVREVLFALPGLAAGIWIGEGSRRSDLLGVAATGTQGATIAPAAAVSTSRPVASQNRDASDMPVRTEGVRMAGRVAGLILMTAALFTLLAALRVAGQGTTNVSELRTRLLAGWVAENILAEHRARGDWLRWALIAARSAGAASSSPGAGRSSRRRIRHFAVSTCSYFWLPKMRGCLHISPRLR